jgi:hypothetical protein
MQTSTITNILKDIGAFSLRVKRHIKGTFVSLMKNPRQQGFVKGHNFSCADKVNRISGL